MHNGDIVEGYFEGGEVLGKFLAARLPSRNGNGSLREYIGHLRYRRRKKIRRTRSSTWNSTLASSPAKLLRSRAATIGDKEC